MLPVSQVILVHLQQKKACPLKKDLFDNIYQHDSMYVETKKEEN